MKLIFDDESFSFELLRALGYASYGGADIGECLATASRIVEGDFTSWYREWAAVAERVQAIGERALKEGRLVSARDALMRASTYHRSSEFYLHGLDDAAALRAWRASRETFVKAAKLTPWTFEVLAIPFEGTTLPAYFFRPPGDSARPTLLLDNGFDGTQEESYFNIGLAALERGYNVLTFEGPGQGAAIREQGLGFRHDWEKVVAPVIDAALSRPEVDGARIALMGVSLGGYLAARAAAFEPRLAALIADDGLYDVFAATMAMAPQAHDLLAVLDLPQALEFDALIEKMKAHATTTTRWALSHGPWAFAVKTPREYMAKLRAYSLVGLAERIACPTLVMEAENDLFFRGQPEQLYAALTCPKTFIRFTAEEGADEHCHCGAARLTNQRVFDWLDGVFKR
jgi:pimeloyl-ACP methyl ester carboxylesterase